MLPPALAAPLEAAGMTSVLIRLNTASSRMIAQLADASCLDTAFSRITQGHSLRMQLPLTHLHMHHTLTVCTATTSVLHRLCQFKCLLSSKTADSGSLIACQHMTGVSLTFHSSSLMLSKYGSVSPGGRPNAARLFLNPSRLIAYNNCNDTMSLKGL